MIARLLLLLALLLPLPAAAQTLEGSWALRIDDTTIFRFDIAPAEDEGEWRGTWSRPGSFASDGNNFTRLSGPPERVRSMAGFEVDGEIELSFDDPRPEAIPDIFRFKLIDADEAEMTYVGTGLAPYLLERVAPGAALGPWDADKVYSRPLPNEDEAEEESREEAPAPPSFESFDLPPGR